MSGAAQRRRSMGTHLDVGPHASVVSGECDLVTALHGGSHRLHAHAHAFQEGKSRNDRNGHEALRVHLPHQEGVLGQVFPAQVVLHLLQDGCWLVCGGRGKGVLASAVQGRSGSAQRAALRPRAREEPRWQARQHRTTRFSPRWGNYHAQRARRRPTLAVHSTPNAPASDTGAMPLAASPAVEGEAEAGRGRSTMHATWCGGACVESGAGRGVARTRHGGCARKSARPNPGTCLERSVECCAGSFTGAGRGHATAAGQ